MRGSPGLRGSHQLLRASRWEHHLPTQKLNGHDAERPCVGGGRDVGGGGALQPRVHHLRRGERQRERERRGAADAGGAAKIDERPPLLPRQPHDVSGLEVAVHIPHRVQVRDPLRHVRERLQSGAS